MGRLDIRPGPRSTNFLLFSDGNRTGSRPGTVHCQAVSKARLEAFTDGVIAIVITIMVLQLKAPVGHDWAALRTLVPPLLTYGMSFVFLVIYWSNHHHMLHAADRINGAILWANLHLLFWLSLTPFATNWM